MNSILILNHAVENCGVYQYGKRFANIVKGSSQYNIEYIELTSQTDLDSIDFGKYNYVVYNFLEGTMPWVNPQLIKNITHAKHGLLVHNSNYATFFDFYLHQNPNYNEHDVNFSLPRLLFDYTPKSYKNTILNIGSFGFGFRAKLYPELCKIVNSQINEPCQINLHMTLSHFCDNRHILPEIVNQCQNYITKSDIKLNITTDFKSDQDILDFLNKNDLNIFLYQKYNSYNGISSVIDYALSAQRPIAICKSNMFDHILGASPSICIEDRPLLDIIESGFDPLKPFLELWSNNKLVEKFDWIINEV